VLEVAVDGDVDGDVATRTSLEPSGCTSTPYMSISRLLWCCVGRQCGGGGHWSIVGEDGGDVKPRWGWPLGRSCCWCW
jgi:hypothetical protein